MQVSPDEYLGQLPPNLFFQLCNAIAQSDSWQEVASRAGFGQPEISNIVARGNTPMKQATMMFTTWRMRMPTLRNVYEVMARQPPIEDAVSAILSYCPMLKGLVVDVAGAEQTITLRLGHQYTDAAIADPVITIVNQTDTQPPGSPSATPAGPLQTFAPQTVLKGLHAINFNSDHVVTVPMHEVKGTQSHCAVLVRGNYCFEERLIMRTNGDATLAAPQKSLARLQSLRHPNLACLMGASKKVFDSDTVAIQLFLPSYRCTLAEALLRGPTDGAGHPLSFDNRIRIVTGLLSALIYLHSRKPALTASPNTRLVDCQTVRLDAFWRPALWDLHRLVEAGSDTDLRMDYKILFELSIEVISGRLRYRSADNFKQFKVIVINFISQGDAEQYREFDLKNHVVDGRLRTAERGVDELDRTLKITKHTWLALANICGGFRPPNEVLKQLTDFYEF